MTAPVTTLYEQFLDLLTGGPADGAEAVRARYGERPGAPGGPQPVVMTRNEWIRDQIDLTLALDRLLTSDDVAVSATPYELSFVGAEVDRVLEMVGASVISVGTSRTICPMPRLLRLIEHYEVTALVCAPNFAAELAGLAVQLGQRPEDSTIRSVVCVGEACSTERLDRIGAAWGATTSAVYGTPSTPTVAVACEYGTLHLCDDRLRAEIRDGELVLGGAPTGELVELGPAGRECACGSTGRALVPLGRVAASVTGPAGRVSAVDVERVVFGHAGLLPHFACEVRAGTFHVTCAAADPDPVRDGATQRSIREAVRDTYGVGAEITIVGPTDWTATS